jgi:hypothetical protein
LCQQAHELINNLEKHITFAALIGWHYIFLIYNKDYG